MGGPVLHVVLSGKFQLCMLGALTCRCPSVAD